MILILWSYDPASIWSYDPMIILWSCDPMILWSYDPMILWSCVPRRLLVGGGLGIKSESFLVGIGLGTKSGEFLVFGGLGGFWYGGVSGGVSGGSFRRADHRTVCSMICSLWSIWLARCRWKKHKKVFVFKHFRGCVVPKVFKNKHFLSPRSILCLFLNTFWVNDQYYVCF